MSVEAIEEYYRENWDDLVRRNTRKCGNVQNAEDVVQEAFVRCLEGVDSFDAQRGDISRWIVRVLTNTFIDFRRQEKARGMGMSVSLSSCDEHDPHLLHEGFERGLINDNIVEKALLVKSNSTHQKLLQHYKGGYTLKEIREIGGKEVWAVRASIQRLKGRLKESNIGKVRIRH